jgi:pentapeptide MXKDX repeat protein
MTVAVYYSEHLSVGTGEQALYLGEMFRPIKFRISPFEPPPRSKSIEIKILKENTMKTLIALCFALSLLTVGVASAQDTMKNDSMKADDMKPVDVMGKISADGKTFVSDKDSKTWTIVNPDAVKGHEGHHVVLNAHVYPDKGEVHVMSLKMAK